jgi:hypothetical protein
VAAQWPGEKLLKHFPLRSTGTGQLPPTPARRASGKEREAVGPPDSDEGLESLHRCSLLRPLGDKGATRGDKALGEAGAFRVEGTVRAAVEVAAGTWTDAGVGLVVGEAPGAGQGAVEDDIAFLNWPWFYLFILYYWTRALFLENMILSY